MWQLSGGQTHLLALAGAVSLQPDILILDEPIAQLDPVHADRIYEVLRELNEHHGKTIIVIEHHTEYIADYCKHVMLMKDDQMCWMLPTAEALQRVEELEACNIFPPQVTQAAHRLRQQGKFPNGRVLPTANLDIATRREILTVLEEMKDIIQTAVIATHDMQLVCQWAERIIVLRGGKVVADGTRDEIFARQDLVDLVGIRPPEIFSMARRLDPRALCYTIEEFTNCFQEA